jgi:hypothetical protein
MLENGLFLQVQPYKPLDSCGRERFRDEVVVAEAMGGINALDGGPIRAEGVEIRSSDRGQAEKEKETAAKRVHGT